MSSSVTLRAFWDQLSTEGRWLLSTVAVQTLGRGLTLPFTVIYLHEVRGFRLLEGYRGHPPADIDALRDTLLRIARLAEEVPEIVELDLNPVIALPPGNGCRIVDARIRVARR